jgi:hypothetical protein
MRFFKNPGSKKFVPEMLLSERTVGIAVEDVVAGAHRKNQCALFYRGSAKPARRLDSNRGLLVTISGLFNIAVMRFAGTR